MFLAKNSLLRLIAIFIHRVNIRFNNRDLWRGIHPPIARGNKPLFDKTDGLHDIPAFVFIEHGMMFAFEQTDICIVTHNNVQIAQLRYLFKKTDMSGVEPVKTPCHNYFFIIPIRHLSYRKLSNIICSQNAICNIMRLAKMSFLRCIISFIHHPNIRLNLIGQTVFISQSRHKRRAIHIANRIHHIHAFFFRKFGSPLDDIIPPHQRVKISVSGCLLQKTDIARPHIVKTA